MTIKEWKSVNDDVVRNAEEISSEILSDSENKSPVIGMIENIPFKKGSFTHECGGNIGKVSVAYCIFQADNENEYKRLEDSGILNCQAECDSKTIIVNACSVNGKTGAAMKQSIAHELNHILQHSKGSEKNNDLYSKMVRLLRDSSVTRIEKLPAYLLYYSFKHEVDSFAAQFYLFLKEAGFDYNDGFEKAVSAYKPYKAAKYLYKLYTEKPDISENDEFISGVGQLGLSMKRWKHIIENGFARFEQKLRNVFRRYSVETQRSGLVLEGIMGRFASLYSRYGIIEEEMEPMFQII